jgi:hypothetical protein
MSSSGENNAFHQRRTDMENAGMGAGFGAIGFWLFLGAIVVAGIWYAVRVREMQQETLRRLIESGEALDPETRQALLRAGAEGDRLDRSLRAAGVIMLFIAPGLAVFGLAMYFLQPLVLWPLLGVAALALFVALGLLVAAKAVARE